MFKVLNLTPRRSTNDNTTFIFSSSADIDYDLYGDFVLADSIEGLSQVVIKAAITTLQPNGYGTIIQALKGAKSKILLSALVTTELLKCFSVVKDAQILFLNKYSLLDTSQIISGIQYIKVTKLTPTKLIINLRVQNLKQRNTTDTNNITIQL